MPVRERIFCALTGLLAKALGVREPGKTTGESDAGRIPRQSISDGQLPAQEAEAAHEDVDRERRQGRRPAQEGASKEDVSHLHLRMEDLELLETMARFAGVDVDGMMARVEDEENPTLGFFMVMWSRGESECHPNVGTYYKFATEAYPLPYYIGELDYKAWALRERFYPGAV